MSIWKMEIFFIKKIIKLVNIGGYMRQITTNVYQFEELSDEAKETALNDMRDINVDYDWWDYMYDDAETIGLKITGFDLDRNRHAEGYLITGVGECINRILKEHGEGCNTYKLAKEYEKRLDELVEGDTSDENEDEFLQAEEDLSEEFTNDLLEEYACMLQSEYEALMEDEAVEDTILANDYEFTEEGKLV
jgi:hypothetical protein